MLRVGGFEEYNPLEQIIFDEVKNIIESVYLKFGYQHIHTPAVEKNEILLAKSGEDASKQIYGLYGLAQGEKDTKGYSLHFDLTIPLARYVIDRQNSLTFPFKRFQTQPVRRGERSQRGRFKEFWQSDIDVVRPEKKSDNLTEPKTIKHSDFGENIYYDAEIIFLIGSSLNMIFDKYLKNKKFTIHVNNRYLLSGFFSQFDESTKPKLYNLFDKYYKITKEKFSTILREILSEKESKIVEEFILLDITSLDMSLIDNIEYRRGLSEIKQIFEYIDLLNKDFCYDIVYDPFVVRGLDYYTGTVYETYIQDEFSIGSISSGGRYENLTKHIENKKNIFSGVGGSIGLTRLLSIILENIKSKEETYYKSNNLNENYLLINFDSTIKDILNLANIFIKNGKNIEIYPKSDKINKQFDYANKKGIKYVIIFGDIEKKNGLYKIKNMITGEEIDFNC